MSLNYAPTNRKRNTLFFNAIPLYFLILSNCAYAQKKFPPDKLLAGKIYTVEMISQEKKPGAPQSDEISFKSDKFTSKLMKTENEFVPSTYTATLDSTDGANKVITFETESKNSSEDLIKWSGTIKGDEIEGTAKWVNKKGKTKKEYTFTGALKGKKKK